MAGRVDINCYHLTSEATFGRAAQVIDIVEIDGLHPWSDLAMYGVMASRVVRSNGDLITRESAGGELYVVVSDFFVRKKP